MFAYVRLSTDSNSFDNSKSNAPPVTEISSRGSGYLDKVLYSMRVVEDRFIDMI